MMHILRSPHRRSAMTRRSLCSLTMLALCLALGATRADAQIRDTSVDVVIGSGSHTFVLADFPGFTRSSLNFESLPDRGTLRKGNGVAITRIGNQHPQGQFYFVGDFSAAAGSDDRFKYVLPDDAISVATPGFTSFRFANIVGDDIHMATMTINLVGASAQMAATGAPTITAMDTGRISASIAGVTEPNSIDVGTLIWQWQQAAAPASGTGTPMGSAYSNIPGATATGVISPNFAPLAAHVGKFVRACVSFKDQFSPPASSGPLCSTDSHRVTEDNLPTHLLLRIFLEGPLR